MDPTGPWSYAYNRIAVAGTTASTASSSSEFQQHNVLTVATTTSSGSSTASTPQFLQTQGGLSSSSTYNTSGFLSPTSQTPTYDPVFTPLFQHIIPKAAHSSIKSENESPTYTTFYNQNAANATTAGGATAAATLTWHQSGSQLSPFGILPHESIVGDGESASGNTNFSNSSTYSLQQSINQIAGIKNAANNRSISPQTKQHSIQQSTTSTTHPYYRQPVTVSSTFVDSSSQTVNKPNLTLNNQTCIVVASQASPNTTKDLTKSTSKPNSMYNSHIVRINEKAVRPSNAPNTTNLAASNAVNSTFGIPLTPAKGNNHILQMQQTKAQSKSYPQFLVVEETERKQDDVNQTDQEPITSYYTIIDGRFAYTATPGGVTNLHSPRHFLLTNSTAEVDTPRIKAEPQYSGSVVQNECSNTIIVPRRASPAQSTSSQVPSPAYPIYNSPMNSIESPSQHSTGSSHPSDSTGSHIVIYKTNQQNQQISSQSPLDASISRNTNNLTNNSPVVYSSVITRALDQSKLAEQYQTCWTESNNEHKQQKIVVPAGINLKQTYYNNAHNTQIGALQNNAHKNEHRVTENILVTTDRPLLSQIQLTSKINTNPQSTAAAAITIPAAVPQAQIHQIGQPQQQPPPPPATKGRRRKNANTSKTREQLLSENEFLVNREPPPAHCLKPTNAADTVISMQQQQQQHQQHHQQQQQQQQQPVQQQLQHQQNGCPPYYDLGRWNIPAKIVGPTMNPNMPPIIPNQMNYGNHIPQQPPPPIMMPHPHTTPMSYYPSIQIHPSSTDLQHTIHHQHGNLGTIKQEDIVPIKDTTPTENEPIADVMPEEEEEEEEPKPKVIVPNIEEELDFLSTDKPPKKQSNFMKSTQKTTGTLPKQPEPPKPIQPNRNGIGFMGSYLKFLNGEREDSPPPIPRTGRRTFQKPLVTSVQIVSNPSLSSTEINPNKIDQIESTQQQQPPSQLQEQSTISLQSQTSTTSLNQSTTSSQLDDNEPASKKTKTRKKKQPPATAIVEKDSTIMPVEEQQTVYKSSLPKKARPQMAMQMPSMYNDASAIFQNTNSNIVQSSLDHNNSMMTGSTSTSAINNLQESQQFLPTTTAAATTSYQYHQIQEDPLILPPRRETSLRKAKTRGLDEIMQKASDNEDQEEPPEFADSDTDPVWTPQDEYIDDPKPSTKRKHRKQKAVTRYKRSNILTAAVLDAGIDKEESSDDYDSDESNTAKSKKKIRKAAIRRVTDAFFVGDFVHLKSEQFNKCPTLWQINAKTILQEYEPFLESGKMFYKSKTLFTTWSGNNTSFYVQANVRKCFQNADEKIVELLQTPLQLETAQFTEKLMTNYLQYKDRFEVYVQTVISQSLDSSFFAEIMREEDEYFMPNISVIDNIIDQCREKVKSAIKWPVKITTSIETWPNYRVIREMEVNKYQCAVCNESAGITFLLSGEAYNNKTLGTVELDSIVASYNKNITMCHICVTKAESLHKITHEKYNLYTICAKQVNELSKDPSKGSTEILKELLANSCWVDELFENVRKHWTDAHVLERNIQLASS